MYISVDETEATLESGGGSGVRWGKLGSPAGRPDYLKVFRFNAIEMYVLGLRSITALGGLVTNTTAAPTAPTAAPTTAPTKIPTKG